MTHTPRQLFAMINADQKDEVLKSVDRNVQRAVIVNEIAIARDEALDLYNAGKPAEAGDALRRKQTDLYERNSALGIPQEMEEEAKQLDFDAQQFEQRSVDSVQKKAIRAGNYRVRSQQQHQ